MHKYYAPARNSITHKLPKLSKSMAALAILYILVSIVATSEAIRRDDFPSGFVFGTASSAYQVWGHAEMSLLHSAASCSAQVNGVADNLSLKELLVRGTGEKVYGILSQDDQVWLALRETKALIFWILFRKLESVFGREDFGLQQCRCGSRSVPSVQGELWNTQIIHE